MLAHDKTGISHPGLIIVMIDHHYSSLDKSCINMLTNNTHQWNLNFSIPVSTSFLRYKFKLSKSKCQSTTICIISHQSIVRQRWTTWNYSFGLTSVTTESVVTSSAQIFCLWLLKQSECFLTNVFTTNAQCSPKHGNWQGAWNVACWQWIPLWHVENEVGMKA